MVRLIAALVGIVFVAALLWGAVLPRDATTPDPVKALHLHPREVDFSFNNPITGTFDRQQLQRGMQVYKEVCSGCHSLNRVAFRNLTDLGFNAPEVKALAKGYDIASLNDKTGEPNTRKGLPSDHFPAPYPNETAARAANNNALPPDLSLITKAREDGSQYVHSLLAGYKPAPKGWTVPTGLYYNPYFRSLNIAMPAPLTDGQVTYADGTKASVEQMAEDVSAFLTWTAEPKLEARRRTGTGAVLFLIILTGLAYASYQRVWRDMKGKKTATPPV